MGVLTTAINLAVKAGLKDEPMPVVVVVVGVECPVPRLNWVEVPPGCPKRTVSDLRNSKACKVREDLGLQVHRQQAPLKMLLMLLLLTLLLLQRVKVWKHQKALLERP